MDKSNNEEESAVSPPDGEVKEQDEADDEKTTKKDEADDDAVITSKSKSPVSAIAKRNGGENGEKAEGDGVGDGDDAGGSGKEDGDDEEDAEWEAQLQELSACPLTIRFTQDKIHPFFYRRGPIVNVVPKIRPVLRAGGDGTGDDSTVELVPPFAPIHCLRKGDELWSLDNRRLYALQLAAIEQWPQRCCIRLLCSDRLPRRKLKTQWRKFQTMSEGRVVNVCARYQQFDTWSWFDRAVEIEGYTLSSRFGTVLSAFEMLPVLGALFFRTGITGYASRTPLIVAFILTFAIDLLRQKVPAFERKICELHVKAVMDGDVREISGCWCCRRRQANQLADSDYSLSAPQLSAMMALILVLLFPYVMGVQVDKLRSSLLSCWLGVACVLFMQLGSSLRSVHASNSEYTGSSQRLSPKHRD